MNGGSKAWWLWSALAAVVLAGSSSMVPAQRPGSGLARVRAVDESRTADWPAGPWKAVPRQDYLDLLRDISRLRARPRSAWIQSASYTARVDGTRLADGQFRLQLVNNAPGPSTIPLAPLGLAIESLEHNGQAPTWGTTAGGNVALVAPPGRSTVTGRWSLHGRAVLSLVEFNISLAPAVQTSLVLDLPTDRRLTASDGHITTAAAEPSRVIPTGHRRLRLNLGRHARCQLVIDRGPTTAQPTPTRLLVRQRSSCQIAVNGARVVTELVFERTGQATRELIVSMPADVRVESILYDGTIVDARPMAAGSKSGPSQAWKITLPDPLPHALQGPSRTLQVTIEADIVSDRAWQLPKVSVRGTQPVGSQLKTAQPDLTLSVHEPLELKTFRAVGWKQTADAVGGRRFTFSRIAAATSLELVIGQPQQSLTADVLTRIDRGQAGWTASAEIAWSAASGASFSTRALLAPGWNIVDLRPVDSAVQIEWRTVAAADNQQQLIVEWSDAVDTTSTRPLLIQLSRTGNKLDAGDLPLIEPLAVDRHRLVLAAAVSLVGTQLGDSTESLLESIRPEALKAPWSEFSSFKTATESAAGGLFRWSPVPASNSTDRHTPAVPRQGPTVTAGETAPPEAPHDTVVDSSTDATDTGRAISMQVWSRLASVDAGLDHHAARISFAGATFRRPFRFQLPAPAHLEAVLVNGQVAGSKADHPWISIPPLEQGALRTIEIRYTTPATTGFLVSNRATPFPRLESDVTFDWEVVAPPDQLIAATPAQNPATATPPNGHWSARWLGPLGRGPHHAMFNPFSPTNWWQLVGGSSADRNAADRDSRRTRLATAPETLAVSLVRHDRLAALSWLVLALTLIVGACCRRTNRQPTVKWTAVGLAVLVLLGWWMPPPWTLLTGAALAASWLLLLLPSSLWRRPPLADWSLRPGDIDSDDGASLGSTRTYRGIPTGLGLLLALAGLSHAIAQDTPKSPPASPRANRPEVLLPVDANGRPSTVVPFAFVRPQLLETLRAERSAGNTDSDVLLRAANYTGTIHPDGSIGLKVSIEAVVTGRKTVARVALPVDGVNLGPDACRVNGQRHPLARDADGNRLLLDLPAASSDTPRVDRIELDLRPTVKPMPRGGSVNLVIPRILAGRLELKLPANPPRVAVPSAIAVDSKAGHYLLGAGRRLRIEWTSNPDATTGPPRPRATVAPLGLVTVHPLESRLEYRLPVTVTGGELSFLMLALPEQLVFRPGDITAPDLLSVRSLPPQSGRQRLLVEFATPRTDVFEIRLIGRLPLTADNQRLTIESGITLSHGDPPVPIVAAPLRLGLNPGGGFQLAAVAPAPEGATAIDVVEFTRDWLADPDASQPVATLAWSLDRAIGLPVEIQPLRPRRVVRIDQFLHVGQERMELTITATARTTGSSIFHHSLAIDPRLKITSIGIQQQDGAERLARSARVGNQLMLYLKDANLSEEENPAGTQNITIQGELPLTVPGRVVLPELNFDDAETTSRTLNLYHAPRLAVTVIGAKPLTPTDDTSPDIDARQVLAGRFILSNDSKPVELTVSRKSLPTPVQMVYHLRPEPRGPWRLQARAIPLPGPRPNGPLLMTVESALLAVNGTQSPLRWQPVPDSQSVEDGRLEAEFRDIAEMTLEAVLPDVPDADRWTPPLPVASGRQIRQRLLVLPQQISWVPHGDVSRLDSWPDSLPRDNIDGTATVWRLDGPNWSLSRTIRSAKTESSKAGSAATASSRPRRARRVEQPVVVTDTTSAWWIAWQILVSSTLATLIAWGLPRLQRSRAKEWIRRRDPVAWLLLGLGWWLAGAGGALGFGLAASMTAVLLLRSRPGRQHQAAPQPAVTE